MSETKNATHPLNDMTHEEVCEHHVHMHKSHELTGASMLENALRPQPLGAGFEPEDLIDATSMEVWETLFSHPSPTDFTLFELYDIDGNRIAVKKVEGY